MTTTHVRGRDIEERWLLYDASEHTLGRMAAAIAQSLMGKDRPTYTPSENTGAHVVVVNGEKARMTSNKADRKVYPHYTGYMGGQREVPFEKLLERRPQDVVTLAVRRMLPKSRLGRKMLSRLKVYTGPDHPHRAQTPVKVPPQS